MNFKNSLETIDVKKLEQNYFFSLGTQTTRKFFTPWSHYMATDFLSCISMLFTCLSCFNHNPKMIFQFCPSEMLKDTENRERSSQQLEAFFHFLISDHLKSFCFSKVNSSSTAPEDEMLDCQPVYTCPHHQHPIIYVTSLWTLRLLSKLSSH